MEIGANKEGRERNKNSKTKLESETTRRRNLKRKETRRRITERKQGEKRTPSREGQGKEKWRWEETRRGEKGKGEA